MEFQSDFLISYYDAFPTCKNITSLVNAVFIRIPALIAAVESFFCQEALQNDIGIPVLPGVLLFELKIVL